MTNMINNESKLNNPYFVYSVGDVFKNNNGENYLILAMDEDKDKAILIKNSQFRGTKETHYIGAKGLRMHDWAHGHYFMANLNSALEWFAEDDNKKKENITPEYITVESVVKTYYNWENEVFFIHDQTTGREFKFTGTKIPQQFMTAKVIYTDIINNYNNEYEADLAFGALVFFINSWDEDIDMDDMIDKYRNKLV